VVVPPPLLYGGAFVVVLVLRWFWPMPIFGHAVALWLGLALLVPGIGMAAWGIRTMQAAGTNVNPALLTTAIVKSGPFRFSRNPLYLALMLLYLVRPHLSVQYVVGHCLASPSPYHHALRSCPARGALP